MLLFPFVNFCNISCNDKQCKNRHPKECRYKNLCRRRPICLYRHQDKGELIKLEEETKSLKVQISKLKETIVNTENKLNTETEKYKRETEEIKAIGTKYKKEIEEHKAQNMFINTYKCEIEYLKREIKELKDEHKNTQTKDQKVI